ncbi:MAG: ribosome biogenesis GTPase Der [Myxococcota bacterium]|nr:ribosome biogenesis GTPase Der [Myxococcota bacterium]
MMPLVAIVGRPNVGKSTLFNRLIGERRAIVLDTPGVTRDRNYGEAIWSGRTLGIIDTGGFEPRAEEGLPAAMRRQALLAVDEADAVIFVVDGRDGLMDADRDVADILRRGRQSFFLAVNKVDGKRQEAHVAEFYELGADDVYAISAEHGRGVGRLLSAVSDVLPPEEADDASEDAMTRIALIGRPNAGKSTLANRLLGDERMIVDATPGTTRDSIDSKLVIEGKEYVLIDTAGLRRKRGIERVSSEGYSVVRTMRAMERCHVAVMLLDATEGITEQDVRIIGIAVEKGRALVIAINKWDAIEKDSKTIEKFRQQLEFRLPFAQWAPTLYISGLTGQRVHKLINLVDGVRAAHRVRIATGPLNRWLEKCVQKHSPPVVRNRRLKLYYATQARTAPPTIVVSCNDPEAIHFSYKRFLVNQFRASFDVEGTPIRLVFRGKKDRFEDD